jgi:hypothetical protein
MSVKNKKNIRHIPKCHDFKLIKSGSKHLEGSSEFEKENFGPCIDAADSVPLEERLTISFRGKDEQGWYFAMMTVGLDDLNPGDEIKFPTHQMTKLVIK